VIQHDLRHAVRAEEGTAAMQAAGHLKLVSYVLLRPGVQAVCLYRVARWLLHHHLRPLAYAVGWLSNVATGADIPPTADLGPGLAIVHPAGVVVSGGVRAGRGLRMHSGAVIGHEGSGREGVPVVGDDVYIGIGAKVLGARLIGDRAKVGANAVVLIDVPADRTAVGVPARVV
jgi:serine O-acetyltransferase